MSLDVYLYGTIAHACSVCGHVDQIMTRRCEFSANITHNLRAMAKAAGIYHACWRPDEIGVQFAYQLIEPLRVGLARMRSEPARFQMFDASNGWGLYEHFVPWVADYLAACEAYPDASVEVSR